MIELDNTGILRRQSDGNHYATTTFTVEEPVPGTFYVEVAGKTIEEAVDNLVDHIREHSNEDELTLRKIKEVIMGFLREGEQILRLHPEFSQALCKSTWTGEDAVKHSVILPDDELLTNQDFAEWGSGENYKPKDWTIEPDESKDK